MRGEGGGGQARGNTGRWKEAAIQVDGSRAVNRTEVDAAIQVERKVERGPVRAGPRQNVKAEVEVAIQVKITLLRKTRTW